MPKHRIVLASAVAALLTLSPCLQALDIQVQGLFKNAAVLVIDGQQHLLKVGKESPEGVKLVAADRQQAVIEYKGEQRSLGLSHQITSNYNDAPKPEVSVRRNGFDQYLTSATINGKRVRVLVDTGANAIAMNAADAARLGVNYREGIPTRVKTAGGVSAAYTVKLNSVDVGGIKVNHIDGFVIEGAYPEFILLGMSFLRHVDMHEENDILHLKGKY